MITKKYVEYKTRQKKELYTNMEAKATMWSSHYMLPVDKMKWSKSCITSTFLNSNSWLWAKHKFPNVSQGPLVPFNLFKKSSRPWEKILKYFYIYYSCHVRFKTDHQNKNLTDLHPSTKQSYHHHQALVCHSNTSSNTDCFLHIEI